MPPILAVIGTTGVGKTKLAIKIAASIGGHIINGDSMQVYKELDIVTNKPTREERASVPHHLFDFVDPLEEYSVIDYQRDAIAEISRVHALGKIPVIVGGTSYYIQSLLWTGSTIESENIDAPKANGMETCHPSLANSLHAAELDRILTATNPVHNTHDQITAFCSEFNIFSLLKTIDPPMANRWHENDIRKIRRSLEVYFTTGKTHSDWLLSQKMSPLTKKLRYPTCVFWLYGDKSALDPRLDSRVDQMIGQGLFNELKQMSNKLSNSPEKSYQSPDYTRGLFQSIGFKEFDAYMKQPTEENKQSGIERMKISTRQYARRQVQWIRNKFSPAMLKEHAAGNSAMYVLNATDLDTFDTSCEQMGEQLAKSYLQGEPNSPSCDPELSNTLFSSGEQETDWKKYTCDVCIKQVNGTLEWNVHNKSRLHRRNVSYAESGYKRFKKPKTKEPCDLIE